MDVNTSDRCQGSMLRRVGTDFIPEYARHILQMIQVFSWSTSNVYKVHLMLEECGLRQDTDWRAVDVDINAGEQFKPEFLRISPNGKIPVLHDPCGANGEAVTLCESGAILLYLAEKTGMLLPQSGRARFQTLQWLMFQVGELGPTLGQNRHFRIVSSARIEYAIERYTTQTRRLYGVMDKRLNESAYIACDEYTLADIAIFPTLRHARRQGVEWADYPRLKEWFDRISARPTVQRVLRAEPVAAEEPEGGQIRSVASTPTSTAFQ